MQAVMVPRFQDLLGVVQEKNVVCPRFFTVFS
jgi:hypothetical protein